MDYHRYLLRGDVCQCIDDFIDRCKQYNTKIATIVKAKRTKSGFLCIVSVKKINRDSNRDSTISKTAIRVMKHADLDILNTLFENTFNFVKDCFNKIPA